MKYVRNQIAFNEAFVSIQGEGPHAGEAALFIRLAECNLTCSWCDTSYTWNWDSYDRTKESRSMTAQVLASILIPQVTDNIRLVVITGGEPLMQQQQLVPLLNRIIEVCPWVRFEVETNGTILPTADFDRLISLFVVSPKLANSSVSEKRRLKYQVLDGFSAVNSVLKFVLREPSEYDEVASIAALAGYAANRIWVMPEATSPKTLAQGLSELADGAIEKGYRLGNRLQVQVWGDQRGI